MKLVLHKKKLFETLFAINLSHKGFDSFNESMVCQHLALRPDENTGALLRDHRIGFRFTDNIFLCYTQCRLLAPPATTPKAAFIIPADDTRFRFLLTASSYFMKTTFIDPVARGKIYYFSNRTNVGDGMYISHDAAEVNNTDLVDVPELNVRDTCLAVIDVFSSGAVNNNYELFAGSTGQLRSPEYVLEFRSRI